MSVRLFVKDEVTKNVHEYGTESHDSLILNETDGSLAYYNLQTGDGTGKNGGYTFCEADGSNIDARENFVDIGGESEIMKIELKGCPLCGREATICECRRGVDAKNNFYVNFRINCIGCGLSTTQYTHTFSIKNGEIIIVNDAFKEATAKWNRRVFCKNEEVTAEKP